MRAIRAIYAFVLLAGPAFAPSVWAAVSEDHTVTVTGESEVQVAPDRVVLTLGVQTTDKELLAAKTENDRKVKAVIETARRVGVAPKDIQTDYLHLEPRYDMGGMVVIGYVVQRSVVATLRDLSRFEELLTETVKSGANVVHGIDFETTQLRKHRDAARALAITAAREKAVALAGSLSQKVGKPLTIREDYAGWWSYYGRWWGASYGRGLSQNVVQAAQEGGTVSEGPFAPGTIRVKASVTTTFELQ